MRKYFVLPKYIDNLLHIQWNGGVVWSKFVDGDPVLGEESAFNLSDFFMKLNDDDFPAEMNMRGFNSHYTIPGHQSDPNPYHIEFRIVERVYKADNTFSEKDLVPPYKVQGIAAPDSIISDKAYIVKKLITGQFSITEK